MTRLEKIYNFFISVLITFIIYVVSDNYCKNLNYQKFLELFITVFSIVVGFLLTISTLLHSLRNEKIDFIRRSGGMKMLNNSLKYSIYSCFFAIIISVLAFLFEEIIVIYPEIIYIVICIDILSFLISLNFTKTFLNIMSDD